jgi:hypothetical protein
MLTFAHGRAKWMRASALSRLRSVNLNLTVRARATKAVAPTVKPASPKTAAMMTRCAVLTGPFRAAAIPRAAAAAPASPLLVALAAPTTAVASTVKRVARLRECPRILSASATRTLRAPQAFFLTSRLRTHAARTINTASARCVLPVWVKARIVSRTSTHCVARTLRRNAGRGADVRRCTNKPLLYMSGSMHLLITSDQILEYL